MRVGDLPAAAGMGLTLMYTESVESLQRVNWCGRDWKPARCCNQIRGTENASVGLRPSRSQNPDEHTTRAALPLHRKLWELPKPAFDYPSARRYNLMYREIIPT